LEALKVTMMIDFHGRFPKEAKISGRASGDEKTPEIGNWFRKYQVWHSALGSEVERRHADLREDIDWQDHHT
jgi:hypothetical protein